MTKTYWEQLALFDATAMPSVLQPKCSRESVLDDAKALINGDRAIQYGDAFDTHSRIAQMWEVVLGDSSRIGTSDVALMMICVKIIRAQRNPGYKDSWVDIAGYAALGAEFAGAK